MRSDTEKRQEELLEQRLKRLKRLKRKELEDNLKKDKSFTLDLGPEFKNKGPFDAVDALIDAISPPRQEPKMPKYEEEVAQSKKLAEEAVERFEVEYVMKPEPKLEFQPRLTPRPNGAL